VRVDVALTPTQAVAAPIAVVVDVIRATSTIAQALAGGYRRVLCCAGIDDARSLRAGLGSEAVVGGERDAVRIDGFDVGASPREFVEPLAETLVLTTTNGTHAVLSAAERCERVLLGSLLNLAAVAAAVDDDVVMVCAGYKGGFALDDAYCAGRIVQLLDGRRTDGAIAAALVASAFPDAASGLNARTYGPPGLEADIAWCARESVVDVVPRFAGRVGPAAEIVAS
jgi:2-phosphosulfolactate phosphatase